jgi:hypothetical protein
VIAFRPHIYGLFGQLQSFPSTAVSPEQPSTLLHKSHNSNKTSIASPSLRSTSPDDNQSFRSTNPSPSHLPAPNRTYRMAQIAMFDCVIGGTDPELQQKPPSNRLADCTISFIPVYRHGACFQLDLKYVLPIFQVSTPALGQSTHRRIERRSAVADRSRPTGRRW